MCWYQRQQLLCTWRAAGQLAGCVVGCLEVKQCYFTRQQPCESGEEGMKVGSTAGRESRGCRMLLLLCCTSMIAMCWCYLHLARPVMANPPTGLVIPRGLPSSLGRFVGLCVSGGASAPSGCMCCMCASSLRVPQQCSYKLHVACNSSFVVCSRDCRQKTRLVVHTTHQPSKQCE